MEVEQLLTIHFVSTNKGKHRSLQDKLAPYGIHVIISDFELTELRVDDSETIAADKVLQAYERIRGPVIALDAAFRIPALNNFPGTYINQALKTIGLEGIMKLMADQRSRRCEFYDVLAYMDDRLERPKLISRTIRGELAEEISDAVFPDAWSLLSKIFIPSGCDNVQAALTDEERARASAQSGALYLQFAEWVLHHHRKHAADMQAAS